jgi:hypothetical protein
VKQHHVASLGSIYGDGIRERTAFWAECDARLERLANRLGPEAGRVRAAIAARIALPTDADQETLNAAAWDSLKAMWADYAKSRADESSRDNKHAENRMLLSIMGEEMALRAQNLRGNWKAYHALQSLLGRMLAVHVRGGSDKDGDEVKHLLQEIENL